MFDYILSLGGTVFVPIIMIVIGLIFRIPWLQAIKAGVTVGIGFVGMGLVIVMAIDSLSPPIKVMIERFGLTLHVFDVGAGPASGVGYATAIGAMIIPIIFLLNVAMLVTRLTKTMNVDIYNYWHYAITGTVVQLMTGSLIYGVLGAICHAALSLKIYRLDGKTRAKHCRSGWDLDPARLWFEFRAAVRSAGCYLRKNPVHEGTQHRCPGDPETLRDGGRSGHYWRRARPDLWPRCR